LRARSASAASATEPLNALVLAGRRGGPDPLASHAGVSHKALAPLGGAPMLLHVVRTLRSTGGVTRLALSIDEPALLQGIDELRVLLADGRLEPHPSRESPSASVLDAIERMALGAPLLVTTADHPLLTREMVEHFLAAASASDADVVVAVVAEQTLRARFAQTRRTWIPLRGERVTGANLFLLRTPAARRAVAFWRRAESFRKRPWRMVSTFGPGALASFALRRLDLDAAFARASRAIGVRVAALRMPFAECAIDVDRPADLELARRILAARAAGA
jgi:molybdopterin-guanine dinucleotide biosynthesis protein A